jgi:hypothetical protein
MFEFVRCDGWNADPHVLRTAYHMRVRHNVTIGINDYPRPDFCCIPTNTLLFPLLDSTGPYPVASTWTTLGVTWLTSFLTAPLN